MTKIVINTDFGGFSLPEKVDDYLCKKYIFDRDFSLYGSDIYFLKDTRRSDPRLIEALETIGCEGSDLKIVEIPDDVDDWYITNYDGIETVREGRSWE